MLFFFGRMAAAAHGTALAAAAAGGFALPAPPYHGENYQGDRAREQKGHHKGGKIFKKPCHAEHLSLSDGTRARIGNAFLNGAYEEKNEQRQHEQGRRKAHGLHGAAEG